MGVWGRVYDKVKLGLETETFLRPLIPQCTPSSATLAAQYGTWEARLASNRCGMSSALPRFIEDDFHLIPWATLFRILCSCAIFIKLICILTSLANSPFAIELSLSNWLAFWPRPYSLQWLAFAICLPSDDLSSWVFHHVSSTCNKSLTQIQRTFTS